MERRNSESSEHNIFIKTSTPMIIRKDSKGPPVPHHTHSASLDDSKSNEFSDQQEEEGPDDFDNAEETAMKDRLEKLKRDEERLSLQKDQIRKDKQQIRKEKELLLKSMKKEKKKTLPKLGSSPAISSIEQQYPDSGRDSLDEFSEDDSDEDSLSTKAKLKKEKERLKKTRGIASKIRKKIAQKSRRGVEC